jgi:hypothetical protein
MEQLLTEPQAQDEGGCQGLKLYFSATAVCIATLSRSPASVRKQLRSILLQEDCRSISNHEVHAEGLIRFCIENSRLRILMHAGFSTYLAPSFWTLQDVALRPPTRTRKHDYFRIAIEWLIRTATLQSLGIPLGCFTVAFDARSEEAAYLWRCLEQAAAARAHLPGNLADTDARDATGRQVLTEMFATLWRLPTELSHIIDDIANGVSIMRLHFSTSEQQQQATAGVDYGTWGFLDWHRAFRPYDDYVDFPGDSELTWRSILWDTPGKQGDVQLPVLAIYISNFSGVRYCIGIHGKATSSVAMQKIMDYYPHTHMDFSGDETGTLIANHLVENSPRIDEHTAYTTFLRSTSYTHTRSRLSVAD